MGENRKYKGGTIVLPCDCKNAGQDSLHGNGRRVFNISQGTGKGSCTVCGKEKDTPQNKFVGPPAPPPSLGNKPVGTTTPITDTKSVKN